MEQTYRDELRSHTSLRSAGSVMIVDADPAFAAVLRSHLALKGQQLISCTAREALRDLPGSRSHALILDFDGLSVEGYDLLTSFVGFLEHLPILICSQHAEPIGPERASLRA